MSLHGEKVTDAVVPHLIQLRQLRIVEFGPATAFSADGIKSVKAALPDCEILVSAASEAVTSL